MIRGGPGRWVGGAMMTRGIGATRQVLRDVGIVITAPASFLAGCQPRAVSRKRRDLSEDLRQRAMHEQRESGREESNGAS